MSHAFLSEEADARATPSREDRYVTKEAGEWLGEGKAVNIIPLRIDRGKSTGAEESESAAGTSKMFAGGAAGATGGDSSSGTFSYMDSVTSGVAQSREA